MHFCGLLDCWVCIHMGIVRARKHLLKSKANILFFPGEINFNMEMVSHSKIHCAIFSLGNKATDHTSWNIVRLKSEGKKKSLHSFSDNI